MSASKGSRDNAAAIVAALLSTGVAGNANDKRGNTALNWATCNLERDSSRSNEAVDSRLGLMRMPELLGEIPFYSALLAAVDMKMLLGKRQNSFFLRGADISATDSSGETAIILAE